MVVKKMGGGLALAGVAKEAKKSEGEGEGGVYK